MRHLSTGMNKNFQAIPALAPSIQLPAASLAAIKGLAHPEGQSLRKLKRSHPVTVAGSSKRLCLEATSQVEEDTRGTDHNKGKGKGKANNKASEDQIRDAMKATVVAIEDYRRYIQKNQNQKQQYEEILQELNAMVGQFSIGPNTKKKGKLADRLSKYAEEHDMDPQDLHKKHDEYISIKAKYTARINSFVGRKVAKLEEEAARLKQNSKDQDAKKSASTSAIVLQTTEDWVVKYAALQDQSHLLDAAISCT